MNEIPHPGFYKSENYGTITTTNGEILAFREGDNEIDSAMTKEEAITILCAIDVPEGNNAFIDKKAHQAIQMAIDALSIEHASGSSEIPNDLEEAADNHIREVVDAGWEWETVDIKDAFIAGAKWQKEQDDIELSKMIASAYQLGLADKEKQMMTEAEKPCHTVEEWMEHIKNADALTKAIFSKGPYNVLYDALNHPYRDCYDAIKEFGELCYQTARKDMLKEAVEGKIGELGFHNAVYLQEPKWTNFLDGFKKGDKVRIIICKKED